MRVHDHICAGELACTRITVHVSPSWVCKQVGPCVFMHVYEYTTNCQCVCAGDTVPCVCPCESMFVCTCLTVFVQVCLGQEGHAWVPEGPAGMELQRCRVCVLGHVGTHFVG